MFMEFKALFVIAMRLTDVIYIILLHIKLNERADKTEFMQSIILVI